MSSRPFIVTSVSVAAQDQAQETRAGKREAFLRLPNVLERTGLCKTAVYTLAGFPKPIKLGGRAVAWIESEIDDWIQETITASRRNL